VIPNSDGTPRLDELYDEPPAAGRLDDVPAQGSAEGELVAGFPVDVIDLTPDATVTSSAVSAEGARVQVSLEATTPQSPAEVLGYYRIRFLAGGFAEEPVPSIAGTTATSFVRDDDTLVVSSKASENATVFSVTGVLVANE